MKEIKPTLEQLEKYKNNKKVRRLKDIKGGYEKIVFATDQDLDGYHIRGLLTGFFEKYMPQMKERVNMLQTPVIAFYKNGKLTHWKYNINESSTAENGETSTWVKGLGSWDAKDLKYVIEKDGIDKMICQVDFSDSEKTIDDWLGDDSAPRKRYISENNFDITKA